MTVVEHLVELRRRIIISILAVTGGAIVCYIFAPSIIRFFLDYYRDSVHNQKQRFVFTGPIDALVTRLKLATSGGIILADPVGHGEPRRLVPPHPRRRAERAPVP